MRTSLGPLSCTVLPEADTSQPPKAIIIFCHGFGAPGDDLVGLRNELVALKPSLRQARFIFPEAPLSLAAYGMGEGSRAWWLLDMDRIVAYQNNDPAVREALEVAEPEGLTSARQAMLKLLDEVTKQTTLPYSKVLLGGFSQGAMLTTDLALRQEEAPLGLAIMSGTLICRDVWTKRAPGRAGLQVFQSHGEEDPLLPYATALKLKSLLTDAGLTVDFTSFDGGHGIALPALRNLATYLDTRLASLSK